jgi:hypothetical protein
MWQIIENHRQRRKTEKEDRKRWRHSSFPGKIFVSLHTIMEVLYNTAHDIMGADNTKLLIKFISGRMATLPNAQNMSGAC